MSDHVKVLRLKSDQRLYLGLSDDGSEVVRVSEEYATLFTEDAAAVLAATLTGYEVIDANPKYGIYKTINGKIQPLRFFTASGKDVPTQLTFIFSNKISCPQVTFDSCAEAEDFLEKLKQLAFIDEATERHCFKDAEVCLC